MSADTLATTIRCRLDAVEARLCCACARAGRRRADVTLIAVTKTVSVAVAAILPQLGVLDLGENRPQELWRKAVVLPPVVRWHLIGHLQSNKIERTLPLVRCIHSVDSLRLLAALDDDATPRPNGLEVLLEINASREAHKHGFAPEEVECLAQALQTLRHLRVVGLMTMAAYDETPERCRPTFALLRNLRDRLRTELGTPDALPHLSMGMSNDFEVAVEEGATMVRVGSVLFDGLAEAET